MEVRMPATVRHPLFARGYARLAKACEAKGASEHRDELLAGIAGRGIEVGAGSGLNFRHYPPEVREVLAVEPEPYLREIAARAATRAPVPVRVADATADALPAETGSVDFGVASLVLCSVPNPQRALAELFRVILWVPKTRPSLLSRRFARRDRISRGAARPP
jgi:SAM-dependent methyltransferase